MRGTRPPPLPCTYRAHAPLPQKTTLLERLSIATVARTLALAESLGAVELRSAALRFAVSHAADIASSPGWEALAAGTQPALLDSMAVSLAAEQAANARLREEGSLVAAFTLLAGAMLGFLCKNLFSGGGGNGNSGGGPVGCPNCGFVML